MVKNSRQIQVGRRLRSLRERKGFTQAELAEAIGLAPEAYGRLERGAGLPRVTTLLGLARALETTTDALLLDEEEARASALPHENEGPELHRIIRRLGRLKPRQLRLLAELIDEFGDRSLS